MTCVICTRDLEPGRYACDGCQLRLDHTLLEVAELHAQLPNALEPGRGAGQRVTGSREAPLPLRVDPLDLSLPLRSLEGISDPDHDQIGHVPVAVELATWVREWREAGAPGEVLPTPAVPNLVNWLRVRLDWACRQHQAVDEFDTAMRDLAARLRRAHGIVRVLPERLDVPCRRSTCNALTLFRHDGDDGKVRCESPDCRAVYTAQEYQEWCQLLASWPGLAASGRRTVA